MRMCVDQARNDRLPRSIYYRSTVIHPVHFGPRSDPYDLAAIDRDRSVLENIALFVHRDDRTADDQRVDIDLDNSSSGCYGSILNVAKSVRRECRNYENGRNDLKDFLSWKLQRFIVTLQDFV